MKSSKKIEVFSKSALVSLKAELSKKQEEARQAKLKSNAETVKPTQIPQKIAEYNRRNVGVDERNQKDAEQIAEEEASSKKSRAALEEKAKLYEKLSKNQEEDDSEGENRYLVDFSQKAQEEASGSIDPDQAAATDDEDEDKYDSDEYDRPSDPEEDWVDYHDCLGRTRRCLRKDLPFIKMKDAKLADSLGMGEPSEETKKPAPKQMFVIDPTPAPDDSGKAETPRENLELMSEDMRKQEMRQKWEQQEAELRDKSDVHYQDVLFDEVRTHGVAYYAFSREEKSRQAEQEELRKLRVETEKGQAAASELRARRQEQIAARLKAARARKRAREGLPPEPEEEEKPPSDKVEDESLTMWPDCKAAEVAKAEEEESERRKAKIEEAEEKRRKRLEKRPLPVRPWDRGKEGVAGGSADPMSQEEWVKKKRDERNQEFAPPPEFDAEDVSVDDFTATDSGWSTSHLRATSKKSRVSGRGGSLNWKKGKVGLKHSSAMPLDSGNEEKLSDEGISVSGQRKGAEIAPPATFDYYGPSSSKQKPPVSQTSLDDAISAGLSYLRQQAEERDKQKEKGLLDII